MEIAFYTYINGILIEAGIAGSIFLIGLTVSLFDKVIYQRWIK